MTNELTRLSPHINQVRDRLSQTTDAERSLVLTLSEELKRFDQQTLQGIRTVAAEHEARRTGILQELQALADGIGMFQPQHGDALPKPVALPQPVAGPPTAAAMPEQVDYGYQYSPPGVAPSDKEPEPSGRSGNSPEWPKRQRSKELNRNSDCGIGAPGDGSGGANR